MQETDLKPNANIYRFLFTAPMHFVGQCDGSCFDFTVGFQSWSRRSALNKYQTNISHFILSIRTEPHNKNQVVVETYDWVGEDVSALLCAFFGKLIVNAGHLQSGNNFSIPHSTYPPEGDDQRAPFNSAKREPNGSELNLLHAQALLESFFGSKYLDDPQLSCILKSAEFYKTGLENFHTKPEISLALLCSALEALLPIENYTDYELYDDDLREIFCLLERFDLGNTVINKLKSRMFQIKRKVIALVDHLLPETFFTQRECEFQNGLIRDKSELLSRLKCVYDLRSRYLHTGDRAGLWYLEHDIQSAEIGLGTPVTQDKKLQKLLCNSMTLTGFERVTFCILRAAIFRWIDSQTTK